MTELLLIRHPRTDLAGTFCGHTDPPLNAAGQAQLEALIDALKTERIETIYTSDLRRAQTMAAAIAEAHRVPCFARPALREIDFGHWEGLTWAEIERRSPREASTWLARYPHQPAPGGELFADFEMRVLAELDRILAATVKRIAVVTHAGVIRTILTMRCGVDAHTALELTKGFGTMHRYSLGAKRSIAVPQ